MQNDMPERNMPPSEPPPPAGDPVHNATPGAMSQAEERQWAMLTHLSALTGIFTGIGFLVAPLIMWLIRKDQSGFVDANGKEAVNFQITMTIALFISAILTIVLVGLIGLLIFGLMAIILPIVAGLKANEGNTYRYPMTLRLIK